MAASWDSDGRVPDHPHRLRGEAVRSLLMTDNRGSSHEPAVRRETWDSRVTLEPEEVARLAEALRSAESWAVSALTRLDEGAAGSSDLLDVTASEAVVETLNALFHGYDTLERIGITPEHPDWRDVMAHQDSEG